MDEFDWHINKAIDLKNNLGYCSILYLLIENQIIVHLLRGNL